MATSIPCCMCEKGQGACLCAGCKKYFCIKDFRNHRDGLLNEMHLKIEHRNELQEKINYAFVHNESPSFLLAQIDEWQQNIIDKIQEAAEYARQQIKCILHSKKVELINQFDRFSKDLIEKKETEDFVEQDLLRLRQNIKQLHQDLIVFKQPLDLELCTERSNQIIWNHLIDIKEKSISIHNKVQSIIIDNQPSKTGQYIHRLNLSMIDKR